MQNLVKFSIASVLCFAITGCDFGKKSSTVVTPTVKPRQPVIALALGGGGAKGFAHIGVIKVLESHGIKPQIVTGTSAGSFVGSLYASGKTPYQLQEIALKLEESDIRDLTVSRQGFVIGQKLQDFVNRQIGNKPIEKFPKRFIAVATALDSGKKTEFNRGNAGQAVRASCSIPNVFIPATIAGKQYIDGGLVSPIPVETARKMGADIVIAVDISARPKSGQSTNLWGLLDQTINIMGQSSIQYELKQADIVIKPAVGHLGVLDLKARNQSILAGEQAAQQQIPQIKKKLAEFAKSTRALQAPAKAQI
ncbi:patatin-like phospholipase family protein [Acinetobacter qingfengensis]|uniref:Esterase n=1 Tax=Acinetobacter qingfengensis TaxID=1262585 RepID=A0A1E7RER3_9GAMM|nr:patatin-like phospholipase family protein [Acinetobacter qingfengensis]KAA8735055.1 patatin-like phospholipase family protein [Acinetobacter qingfengensis]OEY97783.1 esterase [Acinetobacter qingfengensis]